MQRKIAAWLLLGRIVSTLDDQKKCFACGDKLLPGIVHGIQLASRENLGLAWFDNPGARNEAMAYRGA